MRATLAISSALDAIFTELGLERPQKLSIEEPRSADHGDLSTNAAMLLAKKAGKPPRELAAIIAARLKELAPDIQKVEVAGPGFCNITFAPRFWRGVIPAVEKAGGAYGQSDAGKGRRVLVEYVSANPTGPLHVGHGRGAAVGDSVARLLRAAGYGVATEYYLNDAGRQMRNLGLSIWLRALELSGRQIALPDDCYKGGYIIDLARQLLEQCPDLPQWDEDKGRQACREYGIKEIMRDIRESLAEFRCEHETFFSEQSLLDNGSVAATLKSLEESGRSFTKDGALWFDAVSLGEDQNRVLRKSDGSLTYFATDIAYHRDKFNRGFDWLVDVWGADHHGYIPRMRAAIRDMGENPGNFTVLLIQLVNFLRDNKVVSMSTRAGEFIPLETIVREVGVDAARFIFLSRSSDTPLDFDLELAKRRSLDNPVYYVQYAHARIHALLERAREKGVEIADISSPDDLDTLVETEEMAILRKLDAFDSMVGNAAIALAPHHVSHYLMELAALLHSYYGKYQIIATDNQPLARARLALSRAVGQTLRNGLFLLGVSAPESM